MRKIKVPSFSRKEHSAVPAELYRASKHDGNLATVRITGNNGIASQYRGTYSFVKGECYAVMVAAATTGSRPTVYKPAVFRVNRDRTTMCTYDIPNGVGDTGPLPVVLYIVGKLYTEE